MIIISASNCFHTLILCLLKMLLAGSDYRNINHIVLFTGRIAALNRLLVDTNKVHIMSLIGRLQRTSLPSVIFGGLDFW